MNRDGKKIGGILKMYATKTNQQTTLTRIFISKQLARSPEDSGYRPKYIIQPRAYLPKDVLSVL